MQKEFVHLIVQLMNLRNTAQIFHWQTTSYASHKASDELMENLQKKIDELVEILQGLTTTRIHFSRADKCSFQYKNTTKPGLVRMIEQTEKKVATFVPRIPENMAGAFNVCDEIMGILQQTRYLLSFDS